MFGCVMLSLRQNAEFVAYFFQLCSKNLRYAHAGFMRVGRDCGDGIVGILKNPMPNGIGFFYRQIQTLEAGARMYAALRLAPQFAKKSCPRY